MLAASIKKNAVMVFLRPNKTLYSVSCGSQIRISSVLIAMPSIRTLKIFLSVARCGTFAAAGNQVGLTPAAIGLQIRALENDLDVQLFDRNARAAVLNPVGRALIPEIEEIVRRYELLEASAGGG